MQPFEILILATILLTILGLFIPADVRSGWMTILPVVTTVLVVLHLFIEGVRWQVIPAYGLFISLLCIAVAAITTQLSTPAMIWRIVGTVFGLFLFVIAVGLPLIFPIFRCWRKGWKVEDRTMPISQHNMGLI